MKIRALRVESLSLAAVAVFLVLGTGAALAQDPGEVTITAQRQVTVTEVGRNPRTHAPIEQTSITRHIDYSDLDLATEAGANMLERRVRDAAKAECQELDRLYPHLHREAVLCAKDVLEKTMPQVHSAIADAKKSASN